ncbi:hypothetical protein ACQEV2_42350 [Streptomyces sp. CA-251387]|uniref:hypothetical protein n=1 Tax=Streptomyces sp. CA-251387 TaxID=3240064 RepID=UPI003D8B3564
MTRRSTPETQSAMDCMDWDNRTQAWLYPNRPQVQPDPRLRLERLRRNFMRAAVEGPGRTRTLRVIAYTLTTPNGHPEPDHARLRAYAEGTWDIKRAIHDEAADPNHPAPPQHRNGWLAARLLLRQGAADGVIAISRNMISPDDAQYEHELAWIGDHFSFVDLLVPESL